MRVTGIPRISGPFNPPPPSTWRDSGGVAGRGVGEGHDGGGG